MKKLTVIMSVLILIVSLFLVGFSNKPSSVPDTYYRVYLDDEIIGVIESKKELEKYIDKKGEKIKQELKVNKVYSPNGLEVKKITTYNKKLDSIESIYKKISKRKPFTVKGYQFTIVQNDKSKTKLYVLDKKIFNKAVENTISSFVGTDKYRIYKSKTQTEIESTGTKLENVYISNNVSVKKTNVSVDESVFIDEKELSQFLLFGKEIVKNYYTVKSDDTVDKVAFNNKVSTEELLVSNPELGSTKALLYQGQQLVISYLNPQVTVVSEAHTVEDIESRYRTEEQYDSNKVVGDDVITQNGENGLERITQKVKSENGVIVYIDHIGKEELKPTINQVVIRGQKIVPSVGTMGNWAWPTASGYRITSDYAYRIHPIKRVRQLHPALDIYAGGVGSPVYSSNNGVVSSTSCDRSYGICIIINHNNGYYTLYSHLSRRHVVVGQTVSKGQRIGDIGMTGTATGPHLHYELWKGGAPWKGGVNINPRTVHGWN
jgi:Membrane proteins related to metalloendopeptidases